MGAPEALPQAPAPTEDPDLITREIIQKMREFDPGDPWDPENPLIRGDKIFPGGRGISNIRPMTVEELKQLRDRLNHGGKKATGLRNYADGFETGIGKIHAALRNI